MKRIIVAEIGINHNGNIEIAKDMISQAARLGCDYVKFQKRTVEKVYTPEELNKYRESPWGTTNRQQKEGLEFGIEEYDIINNHCQGLGIGWFASPWDCRSVRFLERYGCPLKIASALITNFELLKVIKSTNRFITLSTGMSTQEEVMKAVDYLGNQIEYILACTSTYPTPDSEMNLKFISTLKKEFPNYKIGFSSHSPGIFYPCAAAVLGAELIEFHFTLDRSMYGSDQPSSIEVPGVTSMVKYIRHIDEAMGTGEWTIFESEQKIRKKLRK